MLLSGLCWSFVGKKEYKNLFSSSGAGECPKGNFEIPDGVSVIGVEQFFECRTLRSVTIPDSVTKIETEAFRLCTNLQVVNFGNSVETIGRMVFADCYSLKSVTIPKSVKVIGSGAFATCYSLVRINVDTDNEFFVEKSGALIGVCQNESRLIQCPGGKEGAFKVPQFVSSIDDAAFAGCKLLTSITFPDGITPRIGDATFYECHKLERLINLPDLEYVGRHAFYECYALQNISLGSVTSIEACAFARCSSIETITIPASCTSIGERAFVEMSSLVSVDFQNCRTSIGEGVFRGCSALMNVFNMTHVTYIGTGAFYQCHALESVVFGDQLEFIAPTAFYECSSLSHVSLGNSLTEIGEDAFGYCSALTYIYIPQSVSSIGNYSFAGCLGIEIEVAPGNKNYISEGGVCISLSDSRLMRFPILRTESYEIPDSIASLGHYCFSGSQLSSVRIHEAVVEIGASCFLLCMNLETITIDPGNRHFKCEDCVIFSFDYSRLVFFPSHRRGSYSIPESVCDLGEGTFTMCQLESITVPDSVTSIPANTFFRSELLKSVTLGNRVETIGHYAFRQCVSLISIILPDSLISIGDLVFYDCESLGSVVLGESLKSISYGAFVDCHSLSSINIPDSVEEIGESAFQWCYSLTSVILGNNVSHIGAYAFAFSGVTYLFLPSSVTEIDGAAFYSCSNLTIINFTGTEEPETGVYVFYECYNIRDLLVPVSYNSDTLFDFPVTKDIPYDATKHRETMKPSFRFLIICACVSVVVETARSYFASVKCRLKDAFRDTHLSDLQTSILDSEPSCGI